MVKELKIINIIKKIFYKKEPKTELKKAVFPIWKSFDFQKEKIKKKKEPTKKELLKEKIKEKYEIEVYIAAKQKELNDNIRLANSGVMDYKGYDYIEELIRKLQRLRTKLSEIEIEINLMNYNNDKKGG